MFEEYDDEIVLLWEILKVLQSIDRKFHRLLHPHETFIESLTIRRNEMALVAIAPGNNPGFTVVGNTAATTSTPTSTVSTPTSAVGVATAANVAPAKITNVPERPSVAKPRVSAASLDAASSGSSATATPDDVVTVLVPAPVWTSSDSVNAPVAASTDGLTATVAIPTSAVVGTEFTLTATYTNPDGSVANGTISLTIVADTIPTQDITSLTITQTT